MQLLVLNKIYKKKIKVCSTVPIYSTGKACYMNRHEKVATVLII